MDAAKTIRDAVARVDALRRAQQQVPGLAGAVHAVKHYQARRFAGTYADLLSRGRYSSAARFFLLELYGDKDFAERDAQFVRIAGGLQRLFPAQVTALAVALADLHALTEQLDHLLALEWLRCADESSVHARYVKSWRACGSRDSREAQLLTVLEIGAEMDLLTRAPGLRLLLRMMRAPAHAAGLAALQSFLETGFDTFAAMQGAQAFLQTVRDREVALMELLFDAEFVACETHLRDLQNLAKD
jgi:hypothetical protein